MITALALMLAVAGYFSFMNHNISDSDIAAEASAGLVEEFEISDEDVLLEEDIFVAEELAEGDTMQLEGTQTAANGTASSEAASSEATETGAEEALNPGEAVLTSSMVANVDYASEMKLGREQIRSKNKETLMEIINNTAIDETVKQDAVNKMIEMTEIAERENAAEMLLEAKGFTDVVVSITEDSCDVVLDMGEVTDAKRAQVEDIVKRKTNISGDKIVITPIVIEKTE